LEFGAEILHSDIKKWCVGSPIQAPLDSLEAMIDRIPSDVSQISAIEVEIQANEVFIVQTRNMPNISLQHLLALFLVDRRLSFESVHDAARMGDQAVLALRGRITLIPSQVLQQAGGRQAIVRVMLNDGQVLEHHTVRVRGTWENPMSREEVDAKARALIEPVLGLESSSALLKGLWSLETMDAADWVDLLESAAASA
jgi:2-methylcitrate dehydratase PrpD